MRNRPGWTSGKLLINCAYPQVHFCEERDVMKKDYKQPTFVRREKLNVVTALPPPAGSNEPVG